MESNRGSQGHYPPVVLLRAPDRNGIRARVEEAREYVATGSELVVDSVSSANAGLCLAIVASSATDLVAKLETTASRLAEPGRMRIRDQRGIYFESEPLGGPGRLALLFPGEGSQYDGGLSDLRKEFPEADRIVSVTELDGLGDMASAVSSVIGADLAIWHLMRELALPVDALLGHSTGELVALIASGMVDAATPAGLERFRRDLVRLAPHPTAHLPAVELIAAGTDATTVRALIGDLNHSVHVGMENCPHQTVIVAEKSAAAEMAGRLRAKAILFERMPFDRPYHTPLFENFSEGLKSFYDRWITAPPKLRTYTCGTTAPFPAAIEAARTIATRQWFQTVRFQDTIETMHADGIRIFVESGMRGNLTAFVGDILRGRPHAAVPANLPIRSSRLQLLHLSAQLSSHGVRLETDFLAHRAQERRDVSRESSRVVDAHMGFMSSFFDVQQSVMHAYLARRGRAIPIERPPSVAREMVAEVQRMPLIGAIVSHSPGRRLVAIKDFSPEEDLYLRDHTFGRDVSDSDPALMGLPVLPLTVSIEMMAEAGALLMPGKVLVALNDVRARRWVACESGRFTLRAEAAVSDLDASRCIVRLFEHERGPSRSLRLGSPVAEVTLAFAPAFNPSPTPVMTRPGELSRRISREEIYRDIMFHGPAFHGIACAQLDFDGSCSIDMEVLPRNRLFESNPQPLFVVDPILLDQIGQAWGVWLARTREVVPRAFPATIDTVEFFGPPPPPAQLLSCVVGNCTASETELVGDAEVLDENGRLIIRVRGWRDRRFDLPDAYLGTWAVSNEHSLSQPWPEIARLVPGDLMAEVSRISLDSLPDDIFEQHRGIWLSTLTCIVLSARERHEWSQLTYPIPRRIQWLLGRVAAKDAVRWYLKNRFGVRVRPADMEIENGEEGCPAVSGKWAVEPIRVPLISISHSGNAVVAVATASDFCAGVGIDVESRFAMNDDVVRAGLAEMELGILPDDGVESRNGWLIRAWCAREAAIKALTSTADAAQALPSITAVNVLDHSVEMTFPGSDASRYERRNPLRVQTAIVDDVCVALCHVPAKSNREVFAEMK